MEARKDSTGVGTLVAQGMGMLDWIKSRSLGARVLMVGVPALVVTFLAVNVYPYEAPEPLWTERDRPSMGEEASNGWFVVTDTYRGEIPEPLADLLDPPDHDAEQFWQRVEPQAEGLREFLSSDAAREANERVDAARRMPAFVDAFEPNTSHSQLTWLTLHRVASLRAIDLASQGDVAGSSMLLRDLIRMDVAHLESASSLISFLVALANLQDAMTTADMIAQRKAASGDANAALAEIARAVQGVDLEAIDLRKVVVGEYLGSVQVLDLVDAESTGLESWLYSRALTLHTLNDRFEHRYERAAEHDTFGALGGGELSPEQDFGWWVRNSVGKTLLDTGANAHSIATSIQEDLAALGETRSVLLSRPAVVAASAQ